MTLTPWTYNGQLFTEALSVGFYGFVYLIVHIESGKQYVGRKYFTKAKTLKRKGKRNKRSRIQSNWTTYWGSNAEVQEAVNTLGEDKFTRTILRLCKKRAECSYWENYEIFTRHLLLSTNSYNKWTSCKIHKKHLTKDTDECILL